MPRTHGRRSRGAIDQVSKRRLAIIAVLLFSVGTIAVFQILKTHKMESYLAKTDAIQRERAAHIEELNDVVAEFSAEPTAAADAAAAFHQEAEEFDRLRARLAEVRPPSAALEYNKAMDELYGSYSHQCSQLAEVADYVSARSRILNDLSSAADSFTEQVSLADSNEELIAASTALKAACDSSLVRLEGLDRPDLLPYSSDQLETNMQDMSAAAGELATGVERLDASKVSSAAAGLRSALDRDWVFAVQQADLAGNTRYQEAEKELDRQEAAVRAARAKIVARQ